MHLWTSANKLKLNTDTTQFTCLGQLFQLARVYASALVSGGWTVTLFPFLLLDQELKFCDHISCLASWCSAGSGSCAQSDIPWHSVCLESSAARPRQWGGHRASEKVGAGAFATLERRGPQGRVDIWVVFSWKGAERGKLGTERQGPQGRADEPTFGGIWSKFYPLLSRHRAFPREPVRHSVVGCPLSSHSFPAKRITTFSWSYTVQNC